jgi:hypothetical protein
MRKTSKTYKIINIINEHFTDRVFTSHDVLNFANDMYKNISFSFYSISQYNNHYLGWGFLEKVELEDNRIRYKMVSQIPTSMSTYLIREFAWKPKEIQREKLQPYLVEIRQLKIKNLKEKINGN